MIRRPFLQSLAIGTVSTVAGCSEIALSTDEVPTVTGIETGYPMLDATFYHVDSELLEESEDEPSMEPVRPGYHSA